MKEIKFKIKTLKCVGAVLFIVFSVCLSLLFLNLLDVKLTKPEKIYYEPDTEITK